MKLRTLAFDFAIGLAAAAMAVAVVVFSQGTSIQFVYFAF